MDMKSLSDYIEKNNLYSTSLNNEIYCSDEIILYFWITNRYSFKECTPIMKTISIFGTGFTYPFKSGFNIGERQYAWTIALKGFISNPLLGIGPENFPILHYKYLELEMSDDSPHLDRFEPHLVFLYYVCDSDGDTIIYDYKTEKEGDVPFFEDVKELKRITPKQGRVVIFDGMYWHTAEQPKKDIRCILNFNISTNGT